MRKHQAILFLIFSLALVFLYSCEKEEVPANPYDNIDRTNNDPQPVEPDPNSIVGLHKNIFFPKCANPGCHDGTFEPDYRTVESTFSTLVYQPVNKDSIEGSTHRYTLRVVPNSLSESWLMERLTTTSGEYMPSNSTRLSQSDIDHVKNWINAGCPDRNGDLPVRPDLLPNIIGYVAFDSLFTRLDTNRVDDFILNPFIVPAGTNMTIAFVAKDTADGEFATPDSAFTVKEIRFSTDKNNFSGATTIQAYFYLSQYQAWLVDVPSSNYPAGTTMYFRIYVNDGNHSTNSEFPRNASLDYYKTLYSFYVQ